MPNLLSTTPFIYVREHKHCGAYTFSAQITFASHSARSTKFHPTKPSHPLSNIIHRPILEIIISARDVFSSTFLPLAFLQHFFPSMPILTMVVCPPLVRCFRSYMFVSVFAYVKNVRRHCRRRSCFI